MYKTDKVYVGNLEDYEGVPLDRAIEILQKIQEDTEDWHNVVFRCDDPEAWGQRKKTDAELKIEKIQEERVKEATLKKEIEFFERMKVKHPDWFQEVSLDSSQL